MIQMKKIRYIRFIVTSVLIFSLSACGSSDSGSGGSSGSGGGSVAPVQAFDASTTNHGVFLPDGVTTKALSGDVDGVMLFLGLNRDITTSPRDVAGFVVERPALNSETNATGVLNTVEVDIKSLHPSFTSTGARTVSALNLAFSSYALTLNTHQHPTDLAKEILEKIGSNKTNGIITDLPTALNNEPFVKEFTVLIGIVAFSPDEVMILVCVVPKNLEEIYSTAITTVTDGTNISPTPTFNIASATDPFTTEGGSGKADFLFVIDNSGSMDPFQTAISDAATAFVNAISNSGLDFQIGTITTDNATLRDTNVDGGFTSDLLEFQSDIKPGTSGSFTETGIFFAEDSLKSIGLGDSKDGTVTLAGFPRATAAMSIIIMSDEPSQYTSRSTNVVFDVNSNLFLSREYRVHSIIDPTQNPSSQYDDLALASGGSTADIRDTTTFSQIMNNIAKEAGGATSSFVLAKRPIASSIKVTVNGLNIPNSTTNGFEYNVSNNSIVFNGAFVPAAGNPVEVTYNHFL